MKGLVRFWQAKDLPQAFRQKGTFFYNHYIIFLKKLHTTLILLTIFLDEGFNTSNR